MNRKQIEELKKTLPLRTHIAYNSWTEEQKQLDKELSCREMIDSCLIYGTDFLNSEYGNDYLEELGESKVLELYNEQLEYFNSCIVIKNTYEDSEGITYNSLLEPEEDGFINCEVVEEPIYNIVNNTNETYFSVKLKDRYGNHFDVALAPQVNNDYKEYYIGRNIGIKVEKTDIGIYKAIEVDFFPKEEEIEI